MSKFEDLTNRKFGYWKVKEYVPNYKKHGSYYLCECKCGTIRILDGHMLKRGKSKSCGCYKRELCSQIKDNLVGRTFDRLKVLEIADHDIYGEVSYLCECTCGTRKIIRAQDLKSGKIKSCGCYNSELASTRMSIDEVGNTYGELEVIKKVGMRRNLIAWLCHCSCGSDVIVTSAELRSRKTSSCGCVKSVGELVIKKALKRNSISFATEYKFDNLLGVGKKPLRFDFAAFHNNGSIACLIEYQGKQHTECNSNSGWNDMMNYRVMRIHDNRKLSYCIKNSIRLVTIPYTDLPKLQASDDYLLSLISPYLKSISA